MKQQSRQRHVHGALQDHPLRAHPLHDHWSQHDGRSAGEPREWSQGFAYCLTHCLAIKRGDYANSNKDEGGMKEWDEPGNWKPLLKEMVRKKNDTALRGIAMQPLTKLDFRDTVKAWGVASWLMDLDRDKFTKVLDQMLDPAVKQDVVIQGEYGKGYEELDEDWHKYALKSY